MVATTGCGDGHGQTVVMSCFSACFPPLKNHGPNTFSVFEVKFFFFTFITPNLSAFYPLTIIAANFEFGINIVAILTKQL